jgi:hypothetical protein
MHNYGVRGSLAPTVKQVRGSVSLSVYTHPNANRSLPLPRPIFLNFCLKGYGRDLSVKGRWVGFV